MRPSVKYTLLGVVVAFSLFTAMAAGGEGSAQAHEGETPLGAAPEQTSAEEELALKYNPSLRLTIQPRPCSTSGNVYNPAPVDVILENPNVELRRLDSERTLITTAPTAEDVAELDEDHDLNWPGNPRRPGCGYEQDYLE